MFGHKTRTKTQSRTSLISVASLLAVAAPGLGTASLLFTASLTLPSAAYAQASTSSVAGVAVPKGAVRNTDAGLSDGLGKMLAQGAVEFHLPVSNGNSRAEVWFWGESTYKEGRSQFMETMLRSALTEAGYTLTNVDAHVENIPNRFDNDAYHLESLDFAIFGDRAQFFHATNSQTKRTIVGFWIDQPAHKRVVLALSEAGFAAGPGETHVPEVTSPDTWLVKNLKNAGQGLPTPPLPAFPKIAGKPGVVRGIVLDGSGKPIANAHLVAWASAAGGFRTSHEGTTNAQGIYEIPLPIGICQIVNADCRITFNDAQLLLPLHPADGTRDQFPSNSGHVENFVLRTSGTADEDGRSYGAPVRVLTQKTPDGCIVEMTLKPVGLLADGTRGKTLVFRWKGGNAAIGGIETLIAGVPLGAYTLTACVYDGGDKLPLRAKPTFYERGEDAPPFVNVLPVKFETENNGRASLGRTSIRRFEVSLEP